MNETYYHFCPYNGNKKHPNVVPNDVFTKYHLAELLKARLFDYCAKISGKHPSFPSELYASELLGIINKRADRINTITFAFSGEDWGYSVCLYPDVFSRAVGRDLSKKRIAHRGSKKEYTKPSIAIKSS